jgi:WD40 repeat protein
MGWVIGAALVAGVALGAGVVWRLAPRPAPDGEPSPPPPFRPAELHCLKGFDGPVTNLIFLAGGGRLLTSEEAGPKSNSPFKVWDTTTGERLTTFRAHSKGASHVALSPSGKLVGSVGAGEAKKSATFRLSPAGSVQEGRRYELPGGTYHLRFSPDDKEALLLQRRFEQLTVVRVDTMNKGRAIRAKSSPERKVGNPAAADISPDGRHVLIGDRNGEVRVWDTLTGKDVFRRPNGHRPGIRAVAFSGDGGRAFTAGDDSMVRVWDWKNKRSQVAWLEGHAKPVVSLAVSADGNWLLSGDVAGLILLWDARTGKEAHRLEGHTADVRGVAFSPDGRLAASGSNDKTVRLWRLAE